jgi:hypothetical protein
MSEQDFEAVDESVLRKIVHGRFWVRQLPYGLMLVLTLGGIAYWSFTSQPISGFWMFLAVLNAVICILTGWPQAADRAARLRLVWTQVLHWLAVLAGMNILLLPNVTEMANTDATGQGILVALAVGTLLAAIHVPAWQYGVIGAVMLISVPAIAWLEASALILVFGGLVLGGIGAFAWNRIHAWRRARAASEFL